MWRHFIILHLDYIILKNLIIAYSHYKNTRGRLSRVANKSFQHFLHFISSSLSAWELQNNNPNVDYSIVNQNSNPAKLHADTVTSTLKE